MKTSLIISLNFHPGHVSHMVASYKQCEELGYESVFYVNPAFIPYLPKGSRIVSAVDCAHIQADLATFLFPSQKNLSLIRKLKRQGTKIVYIFHEPLAPMKVYRKAGFSIKYLAKLWVIDHVSALTVKWSDFILIPSRKAIKYYQENSLYKNKKYFYLPLMYSDEYKENNAKVPRQFFSYIGTVAADHSFSEYLNFVEWAVTNNKLGCIKFLIGTKSEFELPKVLQDSNRVIIHKGKPMSDDEINAYYNSSIAVWNAYARTTQSGVLAKSFMFGTPALVMRKNLNEFTHDGQNVVAIDDNTNMEEIAAAIEKIYANRENFYHECRKEFEMSFYYRVYNSKFNEIISMG